MHDVATREKRFLGSELAFVHCYLILDRVQKYSNPQWLHLYNPSKLDEEISRNWLVYYTLASTVVVVLFLLLSFSGFAVSCNDSVLRLSKNNLARDQLLLMNAPTLLPSIAVLLKLASLNILRNPRNCTEREVPVIHTVVSTIDNEVQSKKKRKYNRSRRRKPALQWHGCTKHYKTKNWLLKHKSICVTVKCFGISGFFEISADRVVPRDYTVKPPICKFLGREDCVMEHRRGCENTRLVLSWFFKASHRSSHRDSFYHGLVVIGSYVDLQRCKEELYRASLRWISDWAVWLSGMAWNDVFPVK